MVDVFISYAREDSEFVRQLVDNLKDNERDVWVDFDDIPFGSDWIQEIVEGIQNAAAGIFVISPDSIQSQYCSLEIAQLQRHSKKIIPIVARQPDEELIEILPSVIRNLHWISFSNDKPFDDAFHSLLETMDTDLDTAKAHTKLLKRALEWDQKAHSHDLLSRGDELASFLPMLERDDLTAIQRVFLDESLRAAQARYNLWRFVFGFLGGLLGMAFYIAAAFRATAITPLLVTNIIAAGEVFGVFTGVMAVFGSNLPEFLKTRIRSELHLLTQIIVCLLAGILTWMVYQWFFLNLPLTPTVATFFGGLGLSLAFIINATFKPHPLVTFIVSAVAMYVPIFIFNPFSNLFLSSGLENPLIYFDSSNHVYTIGVPMVLLFAVGANGHLLWQWIYGHNEVTDFISSGKYKLSARI